MMVTLPKPNGGFRWTQPFDSGDHRVASGELVLVCDALTPFADHFFTTRRWRLGDRAADSANGWLEIAQAAQVGVEHLARLQQVHGADAMTYKKGERVPAGIIPEADIALTDAPAVAVAIQTADCLPILIADRRTHAVAAAHAGWRGLAARVPLVAVNRLVADLGSRAGDLIVAVGPAIGACCYEVGEDVRTAFGRSGFSEAERDHWFRVEPSTFAGNPRMPSVGSARRPDHWFFDGWSCAREQLASAGVPRDQIVMSELCTASHGEVFCSYRRDGAVAGRLAAVIRPRP
jgi:YfiH family protein